MFSILLTIIPCYTIIAFFFFYIRKQKKTIKKLRSIPNTIQYKNSNILFDSDSLTEPFFEKKIVMTSEIEARLLSKLQEFESTVQFTRKTISLSYLATFCETNSRYLSHIINTHKGKSFRNYINELRIDYIIKKLETNPQYRKFKIATLAEECGFSSQNKFAQVFKKEKNISPSAFIKNLTDKTYKH